QLPVSLYQFQRSPENGFRPATLLLPHFNEPLFTSPTIASKVC
nr:hypothetical protein [Tanacetum cinerariifolium]